MDERRRRDINLKKNRFSELCFSPGRWICGMAIKQGRGMSSRPLLNNQQVSESKTKHTHIYGVVAAFAYAFAYKCHMMCRLGYNIITIVKCVASRESEFTTSHVCFVLILPLLIILLIFVKLTNLSQ